MKILCFFLLCLLVFGCSKKNNSDDLLDINSFPQEWRLTGMSGGLAGGFFSGNEMSWQEALTLQNDMTFLKVRQLDNDKFEGRGTFTFNEKDGEMYLTLEYYSETELIESCTGEKSTESFFMPSTTSLSGGSAPCDGPGLFYERIK
jgi:hypothetical protein